MSTTSVDAAQSKPVVFLGSSSEAVERGILDKLASEMDDHFSVRRWDSEIVARPGRYILEVLLEEAPRADAALLIFAKDDEREFREQRAFATRDNVILEYGLFVGALDRDRVWILKEEEVEVPSDVLGITTYQFRSRTGRDQDEDFRRSVDAMREKWGDLTPQAGGEDANLGFVSTLREQKQILARLANDLHRFTRLRQPSRSEPIVLDSQRACVRTYSEALERVQERFWTTTFLSSGFWTRPEPAISQANIDMLARLEDKPGAVRRLFLLDQEPHQVREAYRAFRVQQRQLGKLDELSKVNKEFHNLERTTAAMARDGVEIRVVHDSQERHRFQLPQDMVTDPIDNELALYDDFRVDVFEGARSGVISRVRTYCPPVRNYEAYQQGAEQYFEQLWQEAKPIEGFMAQLWSAVNAAHAKIDYEPNWLAIYEFALEPDDEALKLLEVKRVEEVLREHGRWGSVQRYLDVGTCTARYPIAMRQAVTEHGTLLGIDEDPDCVRFARANIRRQCPSEGRITIEQRDFLGTEEGLHGPFDLITCMLGTVSHFGWDRKPDDGVDPGTRDDQLQAAVARLAELLDPDHGLLVLGTWSAEACRRKDMLRIYGDSDRARLAAWSPPLDELRKRLARAGLEVTHQAQPEERLDFLVCERREWALGEVPQPASSLAGERPR